MQHRSQLGALRLLAALALLVLALAPAQSTSPNSQTSNLKPQTSNLGAAADWTPGRVLLKPQTPTALQTGPLAAVRARFGLTAAREIAPGSATYALDGPAALDVPAAVAALRATGAVAFAEPDYIQHGAIIPNDERYNDQQWWLTLEQDQAAWDITTGDPNLIIAILDTGIAANHPEFEGRILPGHNFVSDNDDTYDDNGHGTHVSGIAAAQGNNGQGIAGLCWQCKLLPVKALNADGQGATAAFAAGIRYAADNGARVINISAGADFSTETEHDAIKYAHDKGVVIVASAGNTPDGRPEYPSGYPEVIAVSASTQRDTVAHFSSYGDYVDIAAPGINILSTWVEGRNPTYQTESGTSMASPMVAGAAALVLSVNPHLSPDQVQQVLQQTADDIGDPGYDTNAGWGRLNVLRALQQAPNGPRPVEPPTVTPPPPAANQSRIQGTISGVDPTLVDVLLQPQNGQPPRDIQPDAAGLYVFDGLVAGKYTVQVAIKSGGYDFPAPQTVDLTGSPDSAAQADFTLAVRRPDAFNPVPAQPSTADLTYFPPVQHTLRGPFLRYWTTHGGLPIFGYPLSEEFPEVNAANGQTYTVQYFERNRFEFHPEFAGTPHEVELGLLGVERTKDRQFTAGGPGPTDATHQWFPQVGHNLQGTFLAYWRASGGLAIFGYPISEEFPEVNPANGQIYTVQYFERNRFELHSEFAGTPNEVLLGLLGVDSVRAKGWIP